MIVAAVIWGFAEATLFFIVPDVLLSAIALSNPRRALLCSLVAAAGAMLGGSVMYFWGAHDPASALRAVGAVPAIGPEMIQRAHGELLTNGMLAVILGPLSATPYKVYAVQAAAAGIPYWLFLLISPIARLPRFLLVSLIAGGAARLLRPRLSTRVMYPVLFGVWIVSWIVVYARLWT